MTMMDGYQIGGNEMGTWDEFIDWMDGFKKINTSEVYFDNESGSGKQETLQVIPYAVQGHEEEEVKSEMVRGITELIGDSADVWVRIMPEVSELKDLNNIPTGLYQGYARFVVHEKVKQ